MDEKRDWHTASVDEGFNPRPDRDDGGDALAAILALVLMLSPLVTATTAVLDVGSVVVGGLVLSWLIYARMRSA